MPFHGMEVPKYVQEAFETWKERDYYGNIFTSNFIKGPSMGHKLLRLTQRRHEKPYRNVFPFIAETWNTLSNIGFIFGACYIMYLNMTHGTHSIEFAYFMNGLAVLMCMIGICSAVHHAQCDKYDHYTLCLDWTPILATIGEILFCCWVTKTITLTDTWSATSVLSLVLAVVALTFLISDHLCHALPVPWGHVLWHIFASMAITSMYRDWILSDMDTQSSYVQMASRMMDQTEYGVFVN
jgi:hypothetical protein